MAAKNSIASFAVLDLETTGIPALNFNKANITEIAVHGFAAADIISNAKTCNVPRITHKLTLLFNPLMRIDPKSEDITGLDNFMLENESSFNHNAANVLAGFLKHLRQPVCLVAHNGDNFDFPVLKHALDKLQTELPDDVLCIDTLPAIKEFDRLANEEEEEIPDSQEFECSTVSSDDEKCTVSSTNSKLEEQEQTVSDRQRLNETTPKRRPIPLSAARKKRRSAVEDAATPVEKLSKSRRSLFQSPSQGGTTQKNATSYKLGDVFTRIYKKAPKVTHHAEADVVILKKVMLHYGDSFVKYAETNAKPFKAVKKLGAR